jgi:hypothetical protein
LDESNPVSDHPLAFSACYPVWILAFGGFALLAFEIDPLPIPPAGITNAGVVLGPPATFSSACFHIAAISSGW